MKIETVQITTARPRGEADPGECAIIHYIVANGEVLVTDPDGCLLRYSDGEPVKRSFGPDDNPRQIAARLGRSYHNETYGDRERGFWRDLKGGSVPV